MIKIYFDDLYWKGRLLVFTWHFKEEFDKTKKPIEFVLDILNGGEHENVILIHIKPTTKKLEGKGK